MTTTTRDPASEKVPTGGLVVQDLRVTLTGEDVDVVDDIDLVLKPGEVVGLVGESGSSKTTVGASLLGTRGPAHSSRRARCSSRAATSSTCRGRRSASCAARRSPTCRRIRRRHSTRPFGSASRSSS